MALRHLLLQGKYFVFDKQLSNWHPRKTLSKLPPVKFMNILHFSWAELSGRFFQLPNNNSTLIIEVYSYVNILAICKSGWKRFMRYVPAYHAVSKLPTLFSTCANFFWKNFDFGVALTSIHFSQPWLEFEWICPSV